jgi:hypothetical protein
MTQFCAFAARQRLVLGQMKVILGFRGVKWL